MLSHSYNDFFAQSGPRGHAIRVDAVLENASERSCTLCGHEWTSDCTPSGRPTVPLDHLTPLEYDAHVETLLHRTNMPAAVCDALNETGDVASDRVRATFARLREWVDSQHGPGADISAGLDDLVIPADQARVADILDAATSVCLTLERMAGALFASVRDQEDLTIGMSVYNRRLDAAQPRRRRRGGRPIRGGRGHGIPTAVRRVRGPF